MAYSCWAQWTAVGWHTLGHLSTVYGCNTTWYEIDTRPGLLAFWHHTHAGPWQPHLVNFGSNCSVGLVAEVEPKQIHGL